MIQVGLVLPLLIGGVAGALVREYKKRHSQQQLALATPIEPKPENDEIVSTTTQGQDFDDVGELHHYQRVSWYALAFAASGSWFYPPASVLSAPLLGYNAYHFTRILRNSTPEERKSALTIFESIGIAGSLIIGRPVAASLLMLFSFGSRKLLLQAGNITNNIGFTKPIHPRQTAVWVMRDGAEIEVLVADLLPEDILVLHSGDTIAVEGEVLSGQAYVRQYSLRKKMKLVVKQPGDRVFPFTRIESGELQVKKV